MKRRLGLIVVLCIVCLAGGYLLSSVAGAPASAHASTLSQRVNAAIDNLLITGVRLLDLPSFLLLGALGVVSALAAILVSRFAGTHRRVRWARAGLITVITFALFALALSTDRRLAKLQKDSGDLRTELNATKMSLLQAQSTPVAPLTLPPATAPAAASISHQPAATQPIAVDPPSPATAPAIAAALSGPRKDFLFDLPAAQKELDRSFTGVTLRPLVYDDASDVVQVHMGTPLIQAYIAIVDLKNPGVAIRIGGSLDEKTYTTSFAKQNDCTLAINGEAGNSPFANSGLGTWRGYMVAVGKTVLKEQPGNPRPFLAFDKLNHPSFIPMQSKSRDLTGEMYNVLWGRLDAVVNGAVQTENERNRQPRTAMGINADGSRLYLMVVDGRQTSYSLGFTRQDVGDFLKAFGASNGMLCDEGGSSCIYMSKFGGVVNSPSDGQERPTYTHFGVSYHPQKN